MKCVMCHEKVNNDDIVRLGCCLGISHNVCMTIHMITDPDMDSDSVECPCCDKLMHITSSPQLR
jgi:hypothetical protein